MLLKGLEKNDTALEQLETLCVDLLKELEDNVQKRRESADDFF